MNDLYTVITSQTSVPISEEYSNKPTFSVLLFL